MLEVESISYLEFLYGVYPTDVAAGMKKAVTEAVERVHALRKLTLVPEVANERSKAQILQSLENATGLAMDFNDVWTDRTTTYNQYRYFRRHLELFDDVFVDEQNVFKFQVNGADKARGILKRSESMLSNLNYGHTWWAN
jgi:hypothetical protein